MIQESIPRYTTVTSYPYFTFSHTGVPMKFEQAFKIVSLLIEEGIVKEMSVKEFTKLVKKVEEAL